MLAADKFERVFCDGAEAMTGAEPRDSDNAAHKEGGCSVGCQALALCGYWTDQTSASFHATDTPKPLQTKYSRLEVVVMSVVREERE